MQRRRRAVIADVGDDLALLTERIEALNGLHAMLAESDFVVITAPLAENTRNPSRVKIVSSDWRFDASSSTTQIVVSRASPSMGTAVSAEAGDSSSPARTRSG